MSHGSTDKCEPNMTPLLDVVLQLVMFFMLCANFVMEELNESIKLPIAVAAKAIDKAESYIIMLNVNEKGHILFGREQSETDPTNARQLEFVMKGRYEELQQGIRAADKDKVKPLVILRAHRNCNFKQVYLVMAACRRAGFERVQLRAILNAEPVG